MGLGAIAGRIGHLKSEEVTPRAVAGIGIFDAAAVDIGLREAISDDAVIEDGAMRRR